MIGHDGHQYAQLRQQELIREAEQNRIAAKVRDDAKESQWTLILRVLPIHRPAGE